MNPADTPEAHILRSWHTNADAWTALIQGPGIASRKRVTNAAILNALKTRLPGAASQPILDVGCGEGWLSRQLHALGYAVHGIDAIETLVSAAEARRESPRERYQVLPYAQLNTLPAHAYAGMVCNFSLFGDHSVKQVLMAVSHLLRPQGVCLIQTLHPWVHQPGSGYQTGWTTGSWAGCGSAFTDPAPWYFRTLESWFEAFEQAGLQLVSLQEPLDPDTGQAASILFCLRGCN